MTISRHAEAANRPQALAHCRSACHIGAAVAAASGCPMSLLSSRSRGDPCQTCKRRGESEFADLPYEMAVEMDEARSRVHVEPGGHVAHQGVPADALYFVTDGLVGLWRTDDTGRRTLVRLVHAGQSLEYLCPLHRPSPYEAIALRPTDMCRIDGEFVTRAARAVPGMALRLMEHAAEDLEAAWEGLLARNTRTVKARVAGLLVDLAQRYGQPSGDAVRLDLAVSRRDIAELVGARVETVVRAIRELQDAGLVAVSGKHVVVREMPAMAREARESAPD